MHIFQWELIVLTEEYHKLLIIQVITYMALALKDSISFMHFNSLYSFNNSKIYFKLIVWLFTCYKWENSGAKNLHKLI